MGCDRKASHGASSFGNRNKQCKEDYHIRADREVFICISVMGKSPIFITAFRVLEARIFLNAILNALFCLKTIVGNSLW